MINGTHAIVYSTNPDADRAFLHDVLAFDHVDAGGGWLIFALPPAEVAVHPSDENGRHELYLMCDDVDAFVADMQKRDVACGAVQDLRWGRLTHVTLPGGGALGVYEPRHARPVSAPAPSAPPSRSARSSAARKPAGKGKPRRKVAAKRAPKAATKPTRKATAKSGRKKSAR